MRCSKQVDASRSSKTACASWRINCPGRHHSSRARAASSADFSAAVRRHGRANQPRAARFPQSAVAGRWAHRPVVLDFGTGSGCLAVTLAVKCPAAVVHAVDISPDALAVARGNAVRHGVDGRVSFHLGDGFAALPADVRFDLLVGNPPYIPSGEIATLQPEVRDHDPRLALDGGADGLDFYRRIARAAAAWLRPDARVMLEFGDGQGAALRGLFSGGPWRCEGIFPDDSGRERILIAAVARA